MRILLFQKMKKETAPVLELLKNIREVHFNNRKKGSVRKKTCLEQLFITQC